MTAEATPRVALILNPTSRVARRAALALEKACAARGVTDPLVLSTTVAEPGGPQARAALEAGADRVVVAGGDGTVRQVAGVLAEHPRPVTLGIVPAGTANLFARNLALPRADLLAAARIALTARPRAVDLGWVRLLDSTGGEQRLAFGVVVGIGHDADAVADVDPALKARLRWLAYFEPGVRRLHRRPRRLTVRVDDGQVGGESVWSLLVVNSATLPAGGQVVPGARLDDGLLHLATVAPRHLVDWSRIAVTGMTGRHRDHPALRYRTGRVVEVISTDPVTVQVDGDPVPDIVSARVELSPGGLLVAAPARNLRR